MVFINYINDGKNTVESHNKITFNLDFLRNKKIDQPQYCQFSFKKMALNRVLIFYSEKKSNLSLINFYLSFSTSKLTNITLVS